MEYVIVILLIILIWLELINKLEIKSRHKCEKIIEVAEEDNEKKKKQEDFQKSFNELMNYTVEKAIQSKRGDK